MLPSLKDELTNRLNKSITDQEEVAEEANTLAEERSCLKQIETLKCEHEKRSSFSKSRYGGDISCVPRRD